MNTVDYANVICFRFSLWVAPRMFVCIVGSSLALMLRLCSNPHVLQNEKCRDLFLCVNWKQSLKHRWRSWLTDRELCSNKCMRCYPQTKTNIILEVTIARKVLPHSQWIKASMCNLLNKGLFIWSCFARTRYKAGRFRCIEISHGLQHFSSVNQHLNFHLA